MGPKYRRGRLKLVSFDQYLYISDTVHDRYIFTMEGYYQLV